MSSDILRDPRTQSFFGAGASWPNPVHPAKTDSMLTQEEFRNGLRLTGAGNFLVEINRRASVVGVALWGLDLGLRV